MQFAWVAAACAAVPGAAFAVDYMAPEQAARSMFPQAERLDVTPVTLDAAQLRRLDDRGIRGRSTRWRVMTAQRAGATLGFVVFDSVIGKVELIDYAVGISPDGTVKQIEILSYRESHGGEVRLPAWRQQFAGKGADSPLRVGEDIRSISGATLSCTHVTEGVRRIVAVVALAREAHDLK